MQIKKRHNSRQLACGCIICICEDEERCQGCGSFENPECQKERLKAE